MEGGGGVRDGSQAKLYACDYPPMSSAVYCIESSLGSAPLWTQEKLNYFMPSLIGPNHIDARSQVCK